MSAADLRVRGLARCDGERLVVAGADGLRWSDHGLEPLRGKLRSRPLARSPWPTFRRLDRFAQVLGLLVEQLHPAGLLDADTRADTALVLGSATGCLAADLRFAASLTRPQGVEPAVFPYTLPSTCLGELAIRHELSGPTLTLSLDAADTRPLLDEVARLLHVDDLPAALVVSGDWLPDGAPGTPPRAELAALLVERGPASDEDVATWGALRRAPDVLVTLKRMLP